MTSAAPRPDVGAGPRYSVLIPCWNAADSIERALRSVLDEGELDLECVVVDDASTDGTLEIVRGIAASDPRVVVLAQPVNAGVSEARNRGLAAVRGEWLTLVDADDRFLPGGLRALAAATFDPSVRAVIGQQIWADGKRTWVHALYDIPDIRVPGRKSIAGSPGLLYYVSPHAKLLHRSIWEGLRFSGRVLGDQSWVVRALLRAGDAIEVLGATVYEWCRPAGQPEASITTRTRSSADRGAEAAAVAGTAISAVADEARRTLPAGERNAVVERYFERLIRSDLSFHLDKALRRKDPTVGALLGGIAEFLGAARRANVPPGRSGKLMTKELVDPVLERWGSFDRPARRAVWALAVEAGRIDANVVRRLPTRRLRIAVRAENAVPEALRGRAGEAILSISRLVTRLRRRVAG